MWKESYGDGVVMKKKGRPKLRFMNKMQVDMKELVSTLRVEI